MKDELEKATKLTHRAFILHPSAFILAFWSDPGLSRNTRCCCYRCSVPGLAGFTKRALCGARDLMSHYQLPIAKCRIQELTISVAVRDTVFSLDRVAVSCAPLLQNVWRIPGKTAPCFAT